MIQRYGLLLLAAAMCAAGCQTSSAVPRSERPPASRVADAHHPNVMVIHINGVQNFTIDGWSFDDSNVMEYVAEKKPAGVLIMGEEGTPYIWAQRVRQKVLSAGVQNVEIVSQKNHDDD